MSFRALVPLGSETEMKELMSEVARRQQLIKNDMELTKKNWRLSVIQGKLLDADGSLIYDWNDKRLRSISICRTRILPPAFFASSAIRWFAISSAPSWASAAIM